MKARDTRRGGSHQARERGAYESDLNMGAFDAPYSSETASRLNKNEPAHGFWRPFEKLRELMNGNQQTAQ